MRMGLLQLNSVSKIFDTITAVDRISFALAEGEFLSLLGPSGSGKTTTLQMIAGLTHPSSGEILLAGRPIGPLPPYKRDIGMVFQNYALFPHLTVARNIAFPLEMRRMRRAEIARRVAAVLKLVDLSGFEGRYPQQLSGGQQQRVALARAIVFEPKLLLMDEPLGALDKKLREQMQLEIKHLHKRLGVSIVYVTHDQDEALVMSDRIGVFNQGRLEQIGTVEELYEQPTTRFVAEFVGETNVIRGEVRDGANGCCILETAEGPLRGRARQAVTTGSAALISVRPERLRLAAGQPARSDGDGIQGHICEVIYMGRLRKYVLDTAGGQKLIVARQVAGVEANSFAVGDAVVATFQPEDAVVLQDAHEHGDK
jgi:putative spermidine/putrescine transport system ATP-binding protein